MKAALRDDLERILEELKGEPGLDALEERVLEAGHLEEDDYSALMEKRVVGQAFDNLRRHLLFCEICSKEFLSRVAPEAEVAFGHEDRRSSIRNMLFRSFFALVALSSIVAVWAVGQAVTDYVQRVGKDEALPVTVDRPFSIDTIWAGQGLRSGVPELKHDRRLYMRMRTLNTKTLGTWFYVFHVAGGLVTSLHPTRIGGTPSSTLGALYPAGGWEDPGGGEPAYLLVLAAERQLPTLQTLEDRQSFAESLRRYLAEGNPIANVPEYLTDAELVDRSVHSALVEIEF